MQRISSPAAPGTAAFTPQTGATISEGGDAPGNTGTPYSIQVGDTFLGTLDRAGDRDWVAVTLTAGQSYNIAVTGIGLSDPYLSLYDSAGLLVDDDDDSGVGFDSLLNFTPATSGTYYVSAGAFADLYSGSYQVSVTDGSTPPPLPPPPSNSPLDAIDWASFTAPSAINVYFVPGGLTVDEGGDTYSTTAWSLDETAQAIRAFAAISSVANVTFTRVTAPGQADFMMIESPDATEALGYWAVGGGSLEVDGTVYGLDGWGVFNATHGSWDAGGLAVGGYGYVTLIHEIGHGMGLAHPHDTGGGSDIMNGVTDPFGSYGTAALNQGIWTTMSYNDGWQTAPQGNSPSQDYGYQATMMALDIAVLQQKYGPNTSTNIGNNTYVLPVADGPGTYYSAIWDAAGVDTIVQSGPAPAVIDLRPATLRYEEGGGGRVSYVQGIHGGFTIAAGVVIEHARGGLGDDAITGNAWANDLRGSDGADTLRGGGKDDRLTGGGQDDRMFGEAGNDTVAGGDGADLLEGGWDNDWLYGGIGSDVMRGDAGIDRMFGEAGNDTLNGGFASDIAYGGPGDDRLIGGDGDDSLRGGDGHDRLEGGIHDDLLSGEAGDDTVSGGTGADIVDGGDGNDWLYGDDGNDVVRGGPGIDRLFGGNGADTLEGGDGDDIAYAGDGDDRLTGADGADSLYGGGNRDRVEGGGRNDRLDGEAGDDTVIGDAGADTLDGGWDNDWLYGGTGNDLMRGGGGIDRLFGADGNDTLDGGFAGDIAYGGAGADRMIGGDGDDSLRGGDGDDRMDGGLHADSLFGEAGDDTVSGGGGTDTVEGGSGNDWLYGNAGGDLMRGGTGIDRLFGGDGNDTVSGDGGDDILYAGDGDDRVEGGGGADLLDGGAGRDTFVFRDGFGTDTLSGFDAMDDLEKIDLSGVAAIVDFADLAANHMAQSGSDVWIDDGGGNTVRLLNVLLADLDTDDFIF